jgi:ribosomal protein S19
MSRSIWKPLFIHSQYLEGVTHNEIKIPKRSIPFLKKRVGQTINIYNGNRWYTITVSDEIVGQAIGQFAPTRYQPIYKKKINNKKN